MKVFAVPAFSKGFEKQLSYKNTHFHHAPARSIIHRRLLSIAVKYETPLARHEVVQELVHSNRERFLRQLVAAPGQDKVCC